MGGTPCKKIILNGRNAAALLNNAADLVVGEEYVNGSDEIIALLNEIEDKAIDVQKLVLKGIGYEGAVGKMLK